MKNLNTGVKRILIVEDEPTICEVCRRVLTSEGFEVDIAANGEAAQRMLEKKAYELCLIDVRTPVMNGKQLYQRIINEHFQLADGVIFTTGDVTDEYIQRFLKLVCRPLLPKPFSPDELKAIVREALRRLEKMTPL